MAKSRNTSTVGNLSFLLNPNLAIKTIADIDPYKYKKEHEFISTKLNANLKSVVDKLGEAVLKEIPETRAGIKSFFAKLKLDFNTIKESAFADAVINKLPRTIKGENREKIEKTIKRLASNRDIASILHLDKSIKDNPILADDFQRAKTFEYAEIANLNDEAAKKLADKDLLLDNLTEASLSELVREKIINDKQKDDLLLSLSLGRLSGENFKLVKELKTDTFKSPVELVSWYAEDWETFLNNNKISPPADEADVKTYAENLRDTVEKSFPSEYFLHRTIKTNPKTEIKDVIGNIARLFKNNEKVISESPSETISLDWKGISATNKKKTEENLTKLKSIANKYNHLGIRKTLNRKDIDSAEKQKTIDNRFDSLNKFYENNPDIDLNFADFSTKDVKTNEDSWNWRGISEKERPFIKKQMAAFQRVYVLGESQEMAELLLKNGFDSAGSIVAKPEVEFLKANDLNWEQGRKIYDKAQEITIASSHLYETIRGAFKGTFKNIDNQSPDLANDLREIDGLDELFGSQDFCECEECRSILSPAAYFTDLMYFVQENISKKVFVPSLITHLDYLKVRRPDLWTLKLSCQNTTTELPYLEVVNDVLEKYLINELSINDTYKMLSQADKSFKQPFNLPLEEIRLFLSHFGLELNEIYKVLREPKSSQYREKLKLSVEKVKIITIEDQAGVRKRFQNISLDKIEVQTFIRLAGITRSELDDLLQIKFLPNIGQVRVKQEKLDEDDIQSFTEILTGLNKETLDLIHRFIRLWKKTNWTIRELELILSAMNDKGILNNLEELDSDDNPHILKLALIINIQERLKLSVEELATIINQFPQVTLKDDQNCFYERMFDLEKIFGVSDVDADGNNIYNTSTILFADKSEDKITPLLLAGLGISESDLEALFGLIEFDITDDQEIDIEVLSTLYRHTSVARGLRISIHDLIIITNLILVDSPITELENIEIIIEFADWLKRSSFDASEMLMILQGGKNPEVKFENDIKSISAAIIEIQNNPKFENQDDQDNQNNSIEEKKELLKVYLQKTFNINKKQLEDEFLQTISSVTIDDPIFETALNAEFTDGVANNSDNLTGLQSLMQDFERFSFLFEKLMFNAKKISFFFVNQAVFGIDDIQNLTIENIKYMAFYQSLFENNDDSINEINEVLISLEENSNLSVEEETTLADFWNVPLNLLSSLSNKLNFSKPALNAIEYLWECLDLCQTLGIQADSLIKLRDTDYQDLTDSVYQDLLDVRNIIVGAFASKYEDEKTREEKLEPYNDKLNTLKRDALSDYIISNNSTDEFKDQKDLYDYFLLDVEMSGCFRTSKLVAAITSLQLYIHRCLLNLESLVDPKLVPANEWEWRKNYRVWEANRKVFLYAESYIDPTLRDKKTHIFKELEDELLQQKITQESAETAYKKYIAQFTELTKLRYAGAFYKSISTRYQGLVNLPASPNSNKLVYMSLANWGSIATSESTESHFYIFARTNTDPYQYYYRTYNHYKKIWGNWQKIELGIEAREISTIILREKLYIYWTEVKSKEISNFVEGDPKSNGFIFKVYVKYSFLDENGQWSAPQRLYVGQNFEEEITIYHRVWDGQFEEDESERDKTRESTLQKFEEMVFRKPYAIRNKNKDNLVGFYHIWSQNKKPLNITYRTASQTFVLGPEYKSFKFHIPEHHFEITNDNFPSDFTASFDVNVEESRWVSGQGFRTRNFNKKFKMQLLLPFIGIAISLDNEFAVPLVVFRIGSLNFDIRATNFNISVPRNEVIDQKNEDFFPAAIDINSSDLAALNDEYFLSYTENGDNGFFVESGSKDLTKHSILQTINSDALLNISSTGSSTPAKLSTILTDELSDKLFADGLEEFLSTKTQKLTDTYGQSIDFRGSYGEYYWETFFHIPFLIANHLNANQKFKEAKWWYERIFNPTAEQTPDDTKPTDRNWQFREFKNLDIQKLVEILTDTDAIEAYKNDPFNPHAIARLRLNAYQKSVVMKNIDNLLDWGDYLFGQDTRESINEAEMLYMLAFDILGKRPVEIGKCKTANENNLTYERIGSEIDKGSEFLIRLENYYWWNRQRYTSEIESVGVAKSLRSFANSESDDRKTFAEIAELANYTNINQLFDKTPGQPTSPTVRRVDEYVNRTKRYVDVKDARTEKPIEGGKIAWQEEDREYVSGTGSVDRVKIDPRKRLPSDEITKGSLVFCVPPNKELLKYWDRIEDRLFKIRNCMNIKGIRRSLSLFSPVLDPMALVRARAAGLSLEDISALLAETNKIPAYRFSYLIEKAKQFTQTVQSFGSALLSALEKKDGEELVLLRSVHEKNILRMTKNIKKQQLKEAKTQYKSTEEGLTNIQNRIDYYQELIDEGLTGWELTQQFSRHAATRLRTISSIFYSQAGITALLPELGSPFSMKWGGKQLGQSADEWGKFMNTKASIFDDVSASAGLEATFQRREQEWKQQLKLAEQELKQSELQLIAADIRQQIAEKDLKIHDENIEQSDELFEFYENKFTNLGLYDYMASTLNRLYREAYNVAYDLAQLAEKAYGFERNDKEIIIQNDNWQFDKAGLLAGERLMLQLQTLEKKYIEHNFRTPEITQNFSLAMLDASQIIELRQTGSCDISIPGIAFEMLYPGQYRRMIKSVRISIPCIAGPHTNISAKLTLFSSEIEKEDKAGLDQNGLDENLEQVNLVERNSITTSGANNDAGVFELNFRDERYLPFEGAGAISKWKLELPSKIRSFDYDTISDVILHISYTALDGDRETAEENLVTQIKEYASTTGLFRLISLRHEFPNSYQKLFSQDNQTTEFELSSSHFPYSLLDSTLNISETTIYLKPKKRAIATPATMNINGGNSVDWSNSNNIPLEGSTDNNDIIKGGIVNLTGSPLKTWSIDAGNQGIEKDKIEDILILIKYKIV